MWGPNSLATTATLLTGKPLPAAAAIAESCWLSGTLDGRLDGCRTLLDTAPVKGLEWARGELTVWLHRLDPTVKADGLASLYGLLLDGKFEAAADEFRRLSMPLANPAGLTSRQLEVLRLIGEGLTNSELADRLYLSAKTVDHHVSAILTKLDVPGRRDAIRRGRELGILT